MAYDKGLVDKASDETGVPASLLERVISAESSGNPDAVSYRGAQYGEGLMQLSEAAAKDFGVTDRFDPAQNIMGGARDLKALLDRFGGDEDRALQAYVGASTPEKAAAYIKKVTGHMPDAANTATAPASSTYQPAIDDALKAQKGDEAAYEKASAAASANDKEYASRLEKLGDQISGIDSYLDRLNAQTPKAPDEPKLPGYQPPQQKNPLQTLAMSMPLLLLAGSKMGRNKGLALMKSMTGLLNGVNAGNDETRKQYQEDFKTKTEQMVHQAQLDHEHYMDILESLRENKGDALAKIQVMGALTQNEELINAAKNGDFKRVADLATIHDHFLQSLLTAQRAALESEQRAVQNKMEERRLSQEDERLAETKRYHEEQSPLKRAQFAEKLRSDLDKSPLGKAYASLDQFDHVIENTAEKLKDGKTIGSMEQSAFLDAYTRIVTGGQAIRGFTLKLNTDHAGLADNAEVWLNKLQQGGPLSKRQMEQAVDVIRDYAKALEGEYKGAVDRADKFARESGVIGDDQSITPFEVDPAKLPGGGPGAAGPEPMPSRKEDLVSGHTYNVPGHGPMKWDGSNFVG